MLHTLRTRASEEKGFTLIELLVVILIIGILAAIALPTFLGQKDKAKDSSAKSDARNAVTQVESCLTETPNDCTTYPGKPASVTVTFATGSTELYTVVAQSEPATRTFSIEKTAAGAFSRTCDTPGVGGCNSLSTW